MNVKYCKRRLNFIIIIFFFSFVFYKYNENVLQPELDLTS